MQRMTHCTSSGRRLAEEHHVQVQGIAALVGPLAWTSVHPASCLAADMGLGDTMVTVKDPLQGAEYGTRSQTVLLVGRDGSAELRERSRSSGSWQEVQHTFKIPVRRQCGLG